MRRLMLWVCWAPLLLSGCFYPAERGRLLEQKVDRLTGENAALLERLKEAQAKLSETLQQVDAKVAQVQRTLDALDKAARTADADVGVQLQKTLEDVAQLRGQVDMYVHKIAELERALAEGAAAGGEKAAGRREELVKPTDKKELFALAQKKDKEGDKSTARQLYAEFLKKWPKDQLAGEAHFGLGETFFSEDKCREALFEYGKVIQEHGQTPSAPAAYLRSADCFLKLKMGAESRLALEEVVRGYPKSDAAKQAKVRLAELDRKKAPASKKGPGKK